MDPGYWSIATFLLKIRQHSAQFCHLLLQGGNFAVSQGAHIYSDSVKLGLKSGFLSLEALCVGTLQNVFEALRGPRKRLPARRPA